MNSLRATTLSVLGGLSWLLAGSPAPGFGAEAAAPALILTPAPPKAPRINGPGLFGVRPGSPFSYAIPATGERPMRFGAELLPAGLRVDPSTGQIAGALKIPGTFSIVLEAKNALGEDRKPFRIVVGDRIALTPIMGWNSWNCWAASVDADKILRSARALVASGLAEHGWTFVNLDDGWQGARTGPGHALQGNEKFPDLRRLCDQIHGLGLKAGIYSTPWVTSYAGFPGGSSDEADGRRPAGLAGERGHRLGRYSFAAADAKQWADWGFDYLKYDWRPNDLPATAEMSAALRGCGRDIVFSLSNAAPFGQAADWARLANSWRTTCDISDRWVADGKPTQYGVSEIGFAQDRWAGFAGPGHWNDPDMLVVGYVGWGALPRPTELTPDEQYSHVSLWCLLSAPLLIGCDLERLDPFTLNLLSNDEVLALDQDALGRQATRVASLGPIDVFFKPLESGATAIGFFNRDSAAQHLSFNKLGLLGFGPRVRVRDLWRQKDLPVISDTSREALQATIPAHGVFLCTVQSL